MRASERKIDKITAGLRTGRLTVLEKTDQRRRGAILWRCRCDCGREILLESWNIRAGRTKSCGCSRKGNGTLDLTGRRFGRLTALRSTGRKKGSSYVWHCRCDCGNETDVSVNSLTTGNTTSCGCARVEALRARSRDISQTRFGRLVALEPTERRSCGSVVWRCLCDCGSECEVSYNHLVTGNTTSCGCRKKQHAQPPVHYVDGTCIEMIDHPILRKDNTSGYTGVQAAADGRWTAIIQFQGRRRNLGVYRDIERAAQVRQEAETALFRTFLEQYYAAESEKANAPANGGREPELCGAAEGSGSKPHKVRAIQITPGGGAGAT